MPSKRQKAAASDEQKGAASGRPRRAATDNPPQYGATRKRATSTPSTNDVVPKKVRTTSLTKTKDKKPSPGKKAAKAKDAANELETDERVVTKKKMTDDGAGDDAIGTSEGHTKNIINEGTQYWLMKAEPESRLEKGVDVKFSIDDLKAKTEPEDWDGVRNPVARNNMRAMRKGDLAFFYHSNCSQPGIVGVMRIVQEHHVDESAFDPAHPYYDPKSTRDKPKWELVSVEFVRKFDRMMGLKELKSFAGPGGPLENMQTLKQSRLSVSGVRPEEWRFILEHLGEESNLGH